MIVTISKHRLRQAFYAPILATAMGLMFARLLAMAKLLPVDEFAELSAALIVSGVVGMLACFGLFLHLQRKLPAHFARNRRRGAAIQISQTTIAAFGVGALGLVVAASGISIGQFSPLVMATGAIHGLTQQLFLIATTESRSNSEPLRFAAQNIVRAMAVVCLAVPVAAYTGSALAVILTEALTTAGAVLLIYNRIVTRLNIPLHLTVALGLRSFRAVDWSSMLALLLLSMAIAASSNVDRWLSSTIFGAVEFAQYSFAWIVMILAFSVQGLVNASAYPMIAKRLALFGSKPAYRLTSLASFGVLFLCLIAIVPGLYAAEMAIRTYYPDYADSIPVLRILAAAAALRISDFWSSFLVIMGMERTSLAINIIALVGSCTIWYLVLGGEAMSPIDLAYLTAMIAASTHLFSFLVAWHAARKTTL